MNAAFSNPLLSRGFRNTCKNWQPK